MARTRYTKRPTRNWDNPEYKRMLQVFHYYMYDDPEYQWEDRREEVMERDGSLCRHCGVFGRGHQAHHLLYPPFWSPPWEVPDWGLMALCTPCHDVAPHLQCYYIKGGTNDPGPFLKPLLIIGDHLVHRGVSNADLAAFAERLMKFDDDQFRELCDFLQFQSPSRIIRVSALSSKGWL